MIKGDPTVPRKEKHKNRSHSVLLVGIYNQGEMCTMFFQASLGFKKMMGESEAPACLAGPFPGCNDLKI